MLLASAARRLYYSYAALDQPGDPHDTVAKTGDVPFLRGIQLSRGIEDAETKATDGVKRTEKVRSSEETQV